jgi:RNA polymerase sigma-70 factor (ECF subfamily)
MSHTASSPARANSYRREEKSSARLQCRRRDADDPMRHEENCMSPADGGAPETLPAPLVDPRTLTALRRDMLRFARLQLRDAGLAEDAVQEAIAGALENAHRYAGQAAFKTWVFGILRNKIVDLLRQGARLVSLSAMAGDEDEDASADALDALFNASGHWHAHARPKAWGDPEAALSNRQFWLVFEACLDHLPANVARIFMMREMLGLETKEICAELGITPNNCHVTLHRARAGLRACLEGHWFTPGEHPSC